MAMLVIKNEKFVVSESSYVKYLFDNADYLQISKNFKKKVTSPLARAMDLETEEAKLLKLSSFRFSEPVVVNSFKEAEELINKTVELGKIFSVSDNISFSTPLFKNHTFKIVNNKLIIENKGKVLYEYGKKYKIDKSQSSLSVIQLYQLVNRITHYQFAIEDACKNMNIVLGGEDMMIKNEERNKLVFNVIKIDELKGYPYLYKLFKKHLFLLKSIQYIGLTNTSSTYENINNDIVNLITSSYFRKYLEDVVESIEEKNNPDKFKVISESAIRRFMSLCTYLGLIKVVEAPIEYRLSKEGYDFNDDYKYYTIPSYDDATLAAAEEKAKILKDKKLTVSTFSFNKLYNTKVIVEDDEDDVETDDDIIFN